MYLLWMGEILVKALINVKENSFHIGPLNHKDLFHRIQCYSTLNYLYLNEAAKVMVMLFQYIKQTILPLLVVVSRTSN